MIIIKIYYIIVVCCIRRRLLLYYYYTLCRRRYGIRFSANDTKTVRNGVRVRNEWERERVEGGQYNNNNMYHNRFRDDSTPYWAVRYSTGSGVKGGAIALRRDEIIRAVSVGWGLNYVRARRTVYKIEISVWRLIVKTATHHHTSPPCHTQQRRRRRISCPISVPTVADLPSPIRFRTLLVSSSAHLPTG